MTLLTPMLQESSCSLHIAQMTLRMYPSTCSIHLLTSASAPGVTLASANVGQNQNQNLMRPGEAVLLRQRPVH